MEMRIDTDNLVPIKLRLYRTPLYKDKLIEEAVWDMLEAEIKERSTSPWRALNKIIKRPA